MVFDCQVAGQGSSPLQVKWRRGILGSGFYFVLSNGIYDATSFHHVTLCTSLVEIK